MKFSKFTIIIFIFLIIGTQLNASNKSPNINILVDDIYANNKDIQYDRACALKTFNELPGNGVDLKAIWAAKTSNPNIPVSRLLRIYLKKLEDEYNNKILPEHAKTAAALHDPQEERQSILDKKAEISIDIANNNKQIEEICKLAKKATPLKKAQSALKKIERSLSEESIQKAEEWEKEYNKNKKEYDTCNSMLLQIQNDKLASQKTINEYKDKKNGAKEKINDLKKQKEFLKWHKAKKALHVAQKVDTLASLRESATDLKTKYDGIIKKLSENRKEEAEAQAKFNISNSEISSLVLRMRMLDYLIKNAEESEKTN